MLREPAAPGNSPERYLTPVPAFRPQPAQTHRGLRGCSRAEDRRVTQGNEGAGRAESHRLTHGSEPGGERLDGCTDSKRIAGERGDVVVWHRCVNHGRALSTIPAKSHSARAVGFGRTARAMAVLRGRRAIWISCSHLR